MSIDSQTGRLEDESYSYQIVEEVAAAKGLESHDLEPLYSVIDPDALDVLFTGASQHGRLTFDYEGCTIQVHSDGDVAVSEIAYT